MLSPTPTPSTPDVKSEVSTPSVKPVTATKINPSPAPVASSSSLTPKAESERPAAKRRESLNGLPRTHKTDGITFGSGEGSTGDKTREKCVEMVYDALASDSDARKLES